MLRELAEAAESGWDRARAVPLDWPRLVAARKCQSPELRDRLKSLWARCKKEMGAARSILDASAAEAAEDLRRSAPAMEALLDLCAAFGRAYRDEKLRRNVTDFSDQEHAAVRLLLGEDGRPTELAEIVSGRYLEVMVDEYQDTNQVQNCIFEAVSQGGRRLFTVGDVKQSIYRFRLADPTIFPGEIRGLPAGGPGGGGGAPEDPPVRNFRSRQPVLDAVNFVFGAIMSREMGEMDYGEEEALHRGEGAPALPEDCDVEFHLLGAPRGEGEERPAVSRPLAEARFVARRIRELLDQGYPRHRRGHRAAAALPAGGHRGAHALPRAPAAPLPAGPGGGGDPLRRPGERGLLLHHGGGGGLRPAADPGQPPAGRAPHRRPPLAAVRLLPRTAWR